MNYFKLLLIIIIALWVIGFWYMSGSSYGDDTWITRLKIAEEKLKNLEIINKKNEDIIKNFQNNLKARFGTELPIKIERKSLEPDVKFEENRRQIFYNLKELSYYISDQLKQFNDINKNNAVNSAKLKYVQSDFGQRMNILLAEFYNLSTSTDIGASRMKKSKYLNDLVQKRFYDMQNPSNCDSAKKLVCDLNKACGFGCQMHHVMYCFIEAYFQGRTMILESKGWRYNPDGYEGFFMPISNTCTNTNEHITNWDDDSDPSNLKAIRLSIIDSRIKRPDYLPLGVPMDLAEKLNEFHGNPFVWWSGQILSYLMRFNTRFQKLVDETTSRLKFKTPCVGVHVRRTDKIGSEAALHELAEYMSNVDDFFKIYELMHPNSQYEKTVYLASDELNVLNEAQEKYKEYNFVFDRESAQSASLQQRYSPSSLQGITLDIYFLSQCDYLVCTFSSQVCRMAYELMQVRYPDASWRFKSLDDMYYFGGQHPHILVAIYDHKPQSNEEIELKVGDEISIAGNHWNGYSKGRNLRTNLVGLFPSYKIKDTIKAVTKNTL